MKTLEAFMHVVVTQEDILFGTELKLVNIEWSKISPTRTTKDVYTAVVGVFLKKSFKR
jgi:hypothetical protein